VLVLEGEAEVEAADERLRMQEGAVALVPATVPHYIRNVGATRLRVVGFFSSAAVVSHFDQTLVPFGESMLTLGTPGGSALAADRRWSGAAEELLERVPLAGRLQSNATDRRDGTMSDNTETAILAGGCFWGVQELLRQRDGVISTRVGYSGGDVANATYRNHGTHAEAVEIVFDPERISYRDLLEFFFQIHDPTTKDRQGNDVGTSYRSEIFYTTDEQREIAEDTIADVDASGLWPGKAVTEVSEAGPFWEAEPEHQDYLQKYPNGYTCHFVRPNWKLPHREKAA
jgi:peptide-methionine (S)-S-oxide reductase